MTDTHEDEDDRLRSVAMQNAKVILAARQRAERELLSAKEELERRGAELAHSLAMTEATLEATTDGILVTDDQGRITHHNANYVEMWRLPPDVVARGDHRALRAHAAQQFANPAAFVDRIEAIYQQSPPETFDVLELADGRVFERCTKIQFVAGRVAGRVWSFRDITERRQVEEALRDETRILDLLNRTGAKFAGSLDLRELLQLVTDTATQMSGAEYGAFFYNSTDERGAAYRLFTLSGAPLAAFAAFGQPRATALFAPTFRGEGVVRSGDVQQDPRYGKSAPHLGLPAGHLPVRSYLAVPVLARTGDVIGGLFFGHPEPGVFDERSERLVTGLAAHASVAIDNARLYGDVQRAAAERAQLLDAERAARSESERVSLMKDEFLANLSHELRTPLNAILGWAHLLASGKLAGESFDQAVQTIERNARAQARLIEDLLDISRIVAGKVRLDVQPLELAAVVTAALDTLRPTAQAKGVRLRSVLDPAAGPVVGDPNRLQQVVWNILANAIKFTPKGGAVDVSLERVDSHLELTVRDNGIGIGADVLPQLFARFKQADSSTTRRHGGLGLGLSIVKQLVELHGGSVRASSAGEDQGATFVVQLPQSPVRDAAPVHPTTPRTPPLAQQVDLTGVKVLVVDDEADARELIKRVLVQCRAQVMTAGGAREGLSLLRGDRPDILISDIGMPEQDGYHFIREVRRLPPAAGGATPAIALTAFARSEDRTRAMLAGYQIHIAKPIEPLELVATVGRLSGRMDPRGA